METTRWARLLATVAVVASVGTAGLSRDAFAQGEAGAAKAGLKVSSVILAEPEVETQLSIAVLSETALPRQTFLRIRGVPLSARLSEGHLVSPGVWAVPLAALPSLKLTAPLASSGRSDLTLALVLVDGTVLNETKASLVVAPAWLLGGEGAKSDRSNAQSSSPQRDAVKATPPPVKSEARREPAASQSPPLPKVSTKTATEPAAAVASTPASPSPPPVASSSSSSSVTASPLARGEPTIATSSSPTLPAPVATSTPTLVPAPAPKPQGTVVAALPPAPVPVPPPPPAALPPARPATPPPAATPAPARPAAPAQPAASPTPPQPAPAAMSSADRSRAESMIQRGDTFMNQGNVAAARQFFRIAAEIGHALGALRLATTYDPVELQNIRIVGLQPDTKLAIQWYERARQLGSADATQRLSRLQGR